MQVQCKRSISKIYFLAKIQNKSPTKNSHLRITATSWPWGTWCWLTTWRTWRRPPTRSTTRGSGSTSWERWWDPAAARPTRWTRTTTIWTCLKYFYIQGKASGDIDGEYKRSVRDFERQKLKAGRKNSFLTDIKYKSLDSILGGQRQKVRNIISNLNFK